MRRDASTELNCPLLELGAPVESYRAGDVAQNLFAADTGWLVEVGQVAKMKLGTNESDDVLVEKGESGLLARVCDDAIVATEVSRRYASDVEIELCLECIVSTATPRRTMPRVSGEELVGSHAQKKYAPLGRKRILWVVNLFRRFICGRSS